MDWWINVHYKYCRYRYVLHSLVIMSSATDCDTTCTPVQESSYILDCNVQDSCCYNALLHNGITSTPAQVIFNLSCIPMQESSSYTTVNNEISSTTIQESSYIAVKSEITSISVQESSNSSSQTQTKSVTHIHVLLCKKLAATLTMRSHTHQWKKAAICVIVKWFALWYSMGKLSQASARKPWHVHKLNFTIMKDILC